MKNNLFFARATSLLAALVLLLPQLSVGQILSSVGAPNSVTFTNTTAANTTLSPGPSFGSAFTPNCVFASGGTFIQAATTYAPTITTRIGTRILPATNYKLNVTAIRVKVQVPPDSPVNYRIAYSLDGGTTVANTNGTDLAPAQTGCVADMASNTTEFIWDMPDFEVTNVTNGLVVRVYFFNAAGGRSAYVTNLSVDGTVQPISSPGSPNTGPATNHYVSASSGDDNYTDVQAQNPATPWKTLARLNLYLPNANPGDSIFFAKGDTFDGTIAITKPGTAGKPIVFTAYGTGINPVINGATRLSGWTQTSPNLWETTCPTCEAATPTGLFINNVPQGMGRWPNANAINKGYRTITGASASNRITDSGLGDASPPTTNWVGAEAVVRTRAYLLDRMRISAQSGNILTFSANTTNNILTGYGYFFQNHISTVDSQGEWFFNTTTKTFTLYSTTDPNTQRIEVPQVTALVTATNLSYLTIRSLTFTGAKTAALLLSGQTNFVFSDNQILNSGIDGLQLASGINANITIENNVINNSQSKAARCIACANAVVRGNTMNNSGTIAGMGASGNGTYGAIGITGSDLLIEHNTFDNTGYIPIGWNGSNVLIKNNIVTNFCYLKDDGGGIYTQSLGNFTNRKITWNIILNGPGAPEGSGLPYTIAAGIYMDDFSPNAEMTDNTIANCDFGAYLHNSGNITMRNNTLYDHESYQIWFKGDIQTPGYLIENYTIEDNIFVSPRNLQRLYDFVTPINNFGSIGTFDRNYYVRPADSTLSILVEDFPAGIRTRRFADLSGWQTVFGKDLQSKSSVASYAPYTVNSSQPNLIANGTFDTNLDGWTLSTATGNATAAVDNTAGLDGNSLKVSFSNTSTAGSVPSAKLAYAIGSITEGRSYRLRFSTIGSTANRTILAYLQSPANADASLRRPLKIEPTRNNYEVLLTATSTLAACNLVFVVFEQPAITSFSVDNVVLSEVDASFPNPDDYIRFVYNTTNAPQTFTLNGDYKDAKGVAYSNTVTVAAFSSAILFKQPVVIPATLKILHQDGDNGQKTNNHLKPNLQLTNTGSAAVPYNELTVRYWFTAENFATINTFIDYAQLGNGNVKMKHVRLNKPRQGADGYVEYAFTAGAGNLPAGGNSGPIQSRIAKQTWTDFNEADDYSYAQNTGLTETGKITLYRNGQLVWGTEPAEVAEVTQVKAQSENKNGNPATNTISTFLRLNNEGNTPIAYKDLSVRYWFTAEGSQALNYWIDYAALGNGKVRGQFVRPATPLTGATTYFEMKFDSTLGFLYPLSNTGNIQYRLAKTDWSAFNETDDYSYKPAAPLADNDRVTVYARGVNGEHRLIYGTEPTANSGTRLAAAETDSGLQVVVSPNPATGPLTIRVTGAQDQPLTVEVVTVAGQSVRKQQIERAGVEEVLRWNLANAQPGMLLLRVATPTQIRAVKIIN